MRAWATAELPTVCAYCGGRIEANSRVYVLQGVSWRKVYDPDCAKQQHQAPDDTGEMLDVTDDPTFPPSLKVDAMKRMGEIRPFTDAFDFGKAASNDKD